MVKCEICGREFGTVFGLNSHEAQAHDKHEHRERGDTPWNKLKARRMKISEAHKGRKRPKEVGEKISSALKGRKRTNEHCRAISEAKTGNKLSAKHKENISVGVRNSEKYREGVKNPIRSRKIAQAVSKSRMKQTRLRRTEIGRIGRKALKFFKPNKIEKKIGEACARFHLPFEYVGDGSLWIENFNPDFASNNGFKKLIEVYGDYWHSRPGARKRDEKRLEVYAKYGYKTLVLWEHEIKESTEKELARSIRDFANSN